MINRDPAGPNLIFPPLARPVTGTPWHWAQSRTNLASTHHDPIMGGSIFLSRRSGCWVARVNPSHVCTWKTGLRDSGLRVKDSVQDEPRAWGDRPGHRGRTASVPSSSVRLRRAWAGLAGRAAFKFRFTGEFRCRLGVSYGSESSSGPFLIHTVSGCRGGTASDIWTRNLATPAGPARHHDRRLGYRNLRRRHPSHRRKLRYLRLMIRVELELEGCNFDINVTSFKFDVEVAMWQKNKYWEHHDWCRINHWTLTRISTIQTLSSISGSDSDIIKAISNLKHRSQCFYNNNELISFGSLCCMISLLSYMIS